MTFSKQEMYRPISFVSGPTYLIDIVHLRAAMNALNSALVGARAVMILEGPSPQDD